MSKRRASPPSGPGRLVQHEHFASGILHNRRTLTVYLPPGYDDPTDRRYPVLYLQDGQNLFDRQRAAYGVTWKADATAERLILAGRLPPLLLVGIDNTAERENEYSCRRDPREKSGGGGDFYGRFLFEEVKPFIDREYRTAADRKHTGLAGSSLGGLIALELAKRHHDQFARCAALSPSLWWGRGGIHEDFAKDPGWMRRMRFWVDMGTREGSRRGTVTPAVADARELVASFDAAGLLPGRDYCYTEVAGGEHNESAWADRFDKVLLFLFGW